AVLRANAAVDALVGHVGRLVGEPEPPPFVLHLADILGREQQLFHADVLIAGPDVHEATRVGQRQARYRRQQEQTLHAMPPKQGAPNGPYLPLLPPPGKPPPRPPEAQGLDWIDYQGRELRVLTIVSAEPIGRLRRTLPPTRRQEKGPGLSPWPG